jgi:hypothetical protein
MPFVVEILAKATLLFVLAGLLDVMLRKSPAATRHALWSVTLALSLALPPLTLLLPAWRILPLPAAVRVPAPAPSAGTVHTARSDNSRPPVPRDSTPLALAR